ncbi:MAG: tetratricopeptide repeat protein [Flavobacterium sp.]
MGNWVPAFSRDSIYFYLYWLMFRLLFSFLIILLLLLNSCKPKTVKNDSAINDSVSEYLEQAGNDSIRLEKRIEYNDQAYSKINLNNNSSITRCYLYQVSYNYYTFSKNEKFKSTTEKLIKLSINSNDSLNIGKGYRNLGLYFMVTLDNDKAMRFFLKSEYFLKRKKSILLSDLYLDKAFIYYYINDYSNSESSASRVLLLIGNIKGNSRKKYDSYNLIATSSNELKNYPKAIEYHTKALDLAQNVLLDEDLTANSQNNIGVVYQNLNNHNKAIKYFEKALSKKKLKIQSPWLYAMLIDNMAYSKFKINNNKELPKLFFDALRIRRENNLSSGIIANELHISEYYLGIHDSIKAKKYALDALSLAKSTNCQEDVLVLLNQLSLIDNNNSSDYFKQYIEISDRLKVKERSIKDKFARIRYETAEIIQEKESAIKQKWIVGSISGIIIIIIILLLIITWQRAKQKELKLIQQQQKSNQDIYHLMLTQKEKEDEVRQIEKKRIARELHDNIMNKLASTKLNLSTLSYTDGKDILRKCLIYVNEINQIEADIRAISHDLNQELFKKEDSFTNMLIEFFENQNKISNTHFLVDFDIEIDWNDVSSEIKMNLYRILQEAIHNINKHAQAKRADINFVLDYPNLCLSIIDDGIGFDASNTTKGIGVQNMKERVSLLNGKITFGSIPNKNTSINIALPLA